MRPFVLIEQGGPRIRAAGLVAWTVLLGCNEYQFKGEVDSPEGTEDTAPIADTAFGDTGCSVDLATWELSPHWERSPMADRVQTDEIGTCVAEAAALPTFPGEVWDTGMYTPADLAAEGIEDGRTWASWDQQGDVDCHHLSLRVRLPPCEWSALQLSSPWFEGVAINDNLYLVIDGTAVWTGGTDYDLVNGSGPSETGGWMVGEVIEISASVLGEGLQTLHFVVEEREEWGGMGFIEPTLIP
jgi:hypothetical protein